jgi:hypothetical protein
MALKRSKWIPTGCARFFELDLHSLSGAGSEASVD